MNRYFIVFYECNVKNGKFTGQSDVTTDGKFFNRRRFVADTKRESDLDITYLVITNIIELPESDYLDWYA